MERAGTSGTSAVGAWGPVGRRVGLLAGLAMLLSLVSPAAARAQVTGINGWVWEANGPEVVGAQVQIYDESGTLVGSGTSGVNGLFPAIEVPAAGTYYMKAIPPHGSHLVPSAYPGVPCVPCTMPAGDPIVVSPQTITSGNIFQLPRGRQVSGVVRDAQTAGGLPGVTVAVFNASGQVAATDVTAQDGSYVADGLPVGTYYLRTHVPNSSLYMDKAWNNVPCTPCSVTTTTPVLLNIDRTGFDFSLAVGGSITGTVSNLVSHVGLSNVEVRVVSTTGFTRANLSETGGSYVIGGLPAGTYYAFTKATTNFIDEVWNNVPCAPCTPQVDGTPITVTVGQPVTGVNFALGTGGIISGTVLDQRASTPVAQSTIVVFSATHPSITTTTTNALGQYQINGLPAGSYYVKALNPPGGNYISEAFNNVPCVPCPAVSALSPVSVTIGATTSNINFALDQGGAIGGLVRKEGSLATIPGEVVRLYTQNGTQAAVARTSSNGAYLVRGLPPGTYFALAGDVDNYDTELFNNRPCPHFACAVTSGTPIVVTTTATPSVNFSLRPLGPQDVVIDFGAAYGLWKLAPEGGWTALNPNRGEQLVSGDLDGNQVDDLVVDFGANGVWAWMNHATWQQLHPFNPTVMAIGDLNGNGHDDLLMVFPGFGLWRWSDGVWNQVHPLDPARLAVANLDGNASRELIVDFPGYGLWTFANNSTWTTLHPFSASHIVAADLTGNGTDELVIDFPGYGVWTYRTGSWVQLHPFDVTALVAGHFDLGGQTDLVLDFGPVHGLWRYSNDVTWAKLHTLSSQGVVTADRDGSGRDEILVDFGPAYGLWQFHPDDASGWTLIHPLSPGAMVGGRLH